MADKYTIKPLKMLKEEYFQNYYVDWVNDPEVTKYLYQGTFPIEPNDASPIYYAYIDHHRNLVFSIHHTNHNMAKSEGIIGLVGIHNIDWISKVGEFRILIGKEDHWGRGLGKRFLEEMMELAFERYNFHKLWLGYNASHIRAEGAYTKSGFKHEAVLEKHHFKNGQYNDLVRMSMFREDYEAWKAQKESE